MGVLATKKSLVQCDKLATASFCRRRLAVVMVRLKMAETMKEAVTFVEQVRGFDEKCVGQVVWHCCMEICMDVYVAPCTLYLSTTGEESLLSR